MKKGFVFIVLLFASVCILWAQQKSEYTFSEKTGEKLTYNKVIFSKSSDGYELSGVMNSKNYVYKTDLSFNGRSFISKKSGMTTTVKRIGNTLYHTANGKTKSFKIDSSPWRQVTFRADSLIKSSKKTEEFWVISDDVKESKDAEPKLQTIKFMLKKDGMETVSVNGKKVNCHRVIFTFPDWKSKFWKAYLWFDKDGLMLKSKVKRGGPWTDYTIMQLISVK